MRNGLKSLFSSWSCTLYRHRRLWQSGIRVAYADLTNLRTPTSPAFDREEWVGRVLDFLHSLRLDFGVRTGVPMLDIQRLISRILTLNLYYLPITDPSRQPNIVNNPNTDITFIVNALIAQAGAEADRGDAMESITQRRNELIFEGCPMMTRGLPNACQT